MPKNDKPVEMSAKTPPSRFRVVVPPSKPKFRDPRFDSLSGELRPDQFENKFSFLKNYMEDDINQLKKSMSKEKDPEQKTLLQQRLTKLQQEVSTHDNQLRMRKKISQAKKQEAKAVSKGKAPFYMKKSKIRELKLEDKFEELQKSGKLQKFIEKKRKANASKDRRFMNRSSD